MAKSLGMIHNVNIRAGQFAAVNEKYNIDLAAELTSQLQRMVRAGTYHKLVGVDMTLEFPVSVTDPTATVSGRIRYFAPTRGRCDAFREAFKSAAELMKSQGVSMRDNKMYDFRAPLNNNAVLNLVPFQNRSTLNGTDGLALVHDTVSGASIFGVHNEGVQPVSTTAANDVFTSGFDTILQGSAGTDFVLNDALPFTGSPEIANEQYEEIPFTLSYQPGVSTGSAGSAIKFSWRPDPALYIAVMCGQMQIVIDNFDGPGTTTGFTLECSFQIAGWKSIMGSPDKKRSSKKKMTTKEKLLFLARQPGGPLHKGR